MDEINNQAVVFDLFGTLVSTFSSKVHDVVLKKMAKSLGVAEAAFAKLFDDDMRTAREMGDFAALEENIEMACHQLGVYPSAGAVREAAGFRYEFMRNALEPRPDAIDTIAQIKAKGYVIGLISDCSPEVPVLWSETPFARLVDAPIFSCEAGVKKPDQRIYNLLCDRLRVPADNCLYVGDGDSSELEGALSAGMDPILIRVKGEDQDERDRPLADGWQGKQISRLSEVLHFV